MPNPATDPSPSVPTAPAPPLSTVVTPYGKGLQIVVVSVKPADFLRYKFYKGTNPATLTLWREGDGSAQYDYDTVYDTTYYYATSQVNTSGLESTQTAAGSGTPIQWQTGDITHHDVTRGYKSEPVGSVTVDGSVPGLFVEIGSLDNVVTKVNDEDIYVGYSAALTFINEHTDIQAISCDIRLYRFQDDIVPGTVVYDTTFAFVLDSGFTVTLPIAFHHISLDVDIGDYLYAVAILVTGSVAPADAKVVADKRSMVAVILRV